MNSIIAKVGDSNGVEFVTRSLYELGIKYSVVNEENLPKEGRYIFISNHPLGGLDGMVLIELIGRYFKEVKFVVNDILMNIKNLESVFVPVNKHGRQSMEYAKTLDALYQSDTQVLYFPAGLCSRKIKGKIVDLDWKKSVVVKAIKYQRDIVPIFFKGRNSNFFYNLANFRKRIGIKANLEMLYLPDEMFKHRNKELQLIIGKPIPYSHFNKTRTPKEWIDILKSTVYALGKGENPVL